MRNQSLLCDLAMCYTLDERPSLTESECAEVRLLAARYIDGSLPHEKASRICQHKFNSRTALEKLREIIEACDDPLPSPPEQAQKGQRRRTQPWTQPEDTRLLSAIWRFGYENWSAIARFVGNGRTRSQCSQRWQRSLDPRISRSPWTSEEDIRLLQAVSQHGEKSWARVSVEIGSRSDVQCRYHYIQIQKAHASSETYNSTEKPATDPPPITVKLELSERIELDLGSHSTSDIFWMLHL
jgi:hypothetical protein